MSIRIDGFCGFHLYIDGKRISNPTRAGFEINSITRYGYGNEERAVRVELEVPVRPKDDAVFTVDIFDDGILKASLTNEGVKVRLATEDDFGIKPGTRLLQMGEYYVRD